MGDLPPFSRKRMREGWIGEFDTWFMEFDIWPLSEVSDKLIEIQKLSEKQNDRDTGDRIYRKLRH